MRPLLLLAICSCAWAGEAWTGTIEVVETFSGKAAAEGDRDELEALAKRLQDRLQAVREQLKQATPTIARSLRRDAAHLEAELERLAVERGGTVRLGRTVYRIAAGRVAIDGDDTSMVADRATRTAQVLADGRRQAIGLADVPTPLPIDKASAGRELLGRATREFRFSAEGAEHVALVAPDLPNPYALTLLSTADRSSYATQLAKLPGMPMEIVRVRNDGTHRFAVTAVTPGPIELPAP